MRTSVKLATILTPAYADWLLSYDRASLLFAYLLDGDATDSSGNGNHATAANVTYSTDTAIAGYQRGHLCAPQ